MNHGIRFLFASLLALTATSMCRADTFTIGDINVSTKNTFPFGGFFQTTTRGTEYQQVYKASIFGTSAIELNSVIFYGNSSVRNADGTYTLSLSTTSAPVDGLDTNMANNIGPDNQTFFTGTLPLLTTDGKLTFSLTTPFAYDPTKGNLLLDIRISDVTTNSIAGYAAYNGDFGGLSSRMIDGTSSGTSGYGLVTTFLSGAPVPEPGTLGLALIGALGSVVLALQRGRSRSPRKGPPPSFAPTPLFGPRDSQPTRPLFRTRATL